MKIFLRIIILIGAIACASIGFEYFPLLLNNNNKPIDILIVEHLIVWGAFLLSAVFIFFLVVFLWHDRKTS